MNDPDGVLEAQGPNSRSASRMCFTSVDDVTASAGTIEAYVVEAIEVEESGAEVGPPPEPELAEELQARLDQDPELKKAFESLTPGRQRGYNMYIAGAKQSKTRAARVEKHCREFSRERDSTTAEPGARQRSAARTSTKTRASTPTSSTQTPMRTDSERRGYGGSSSWPDGGV